MLDQEKWIASQSIMKELVAKMPMLTYANTKEFLETHFEMCTKIMEDYATLSAEDEYINTGVRVPKDYWDLPTYEAKEKRIGEGNRVQKVMDESGASKGWFVFSKKKDIEKFKKQFEEIL